MPYLYAIIVGVLMTSCTLAESLDWPPTPYQADYELSINGQVIGDASRRLSQVSPGHWLYQTQAQAGLIAHAEESSEFTISGDQIHPQHYHLQRQMLLSLRHTDLDFDWSAHTLSTRTERDDTRHYPLPENSLDKLSLELQMRRDLQNGQAHLVYPLADADGIKNYQYQVSSHESLSTALGTFDTVKIERPHTAQDKRYTLFWVAPQLGYLPVQIEQYENGTDFILRIKAYHRGAPGADQALGKVTPR